MPNGRLDFLYRVFQVYGESKCLVHMSHMDRSPLGLAEDGPLGSFYRFVDPDSRKKHYSPLFLWMRSRIIH